MVCSELAGFCRVWTWLLILNWEALSAGSQTVPLRWCHTPWCQWRKHLFDLASWPWPWLFLSCHWLPGWLLGWLPIWGMLFRGGFANRCLPIGVLPVTLDWGMGNAFSAVKVSGLLHFLINPLNTLSPSWWMVHCWHNVKCRGGGAATPCCTMQ